MEKESVSKFQERMRLMGEGEYFRKSVPQDHASRFELLDTVWVMKDNRPVSGIVCEIIVTIKPKPHGGKLGEVRYKLSDVSSLTSANYEDCFLEVDEAHCFESKDSLLVQRSLCFLQNLRRKWKDTFS